MHGHLRKSKIEDLISEHTTRFLDTVLTVEVSTGSVFKPMRVRTNAFLPKTGDLLRQFSLTPAEADQASQLVQRPSAPVGILGLSLTDLKKKCNNHIEDMISNTQYAAQATAGDMSQLPRQILEIVCEYSAAKKDVSLPSNPIISLLTKVPGCVAAKRTQAPRHPLFHGLSHNLLGKIRSRDLLHFLTDLDTPILSLIASPKPPDQICDAQITSRNHTPRARGPRTLFTFPHQRLLGSLILRHPYPLLMHRRITNCCRYDGSLRHARKGSGSVVHT
jgi:hypothetical protein